MPRIQLFRLCMFELLYFLHCPGTKQPSLPALLYPYLTDLNLGNRSPEVLRGSDLPGFHGVASLLFPILFQAQLQLLSLVVRL